MTTLYKLFPTIKVWRWPRRTPIPDLFDADWYLHQYPDVADAGMDPPYHYAKYGWVEGRLPCADSARLWAEGDTSIIARLQAALTSRRTDHVAQAAWMLGRWYASRGHWARALDVMQRLDTRAAKQSMPLPMKLLWLDVLRDCGQFESAQADLDKWTALPAYPIDLDLSAANLEKHRWATAGGGGNVRHAWLERVNRIYERNDLARMCWVGQAEGTLSMDALCCVRVKDARKAYPRQPLVSVIVPVFNAEATISTALRSLLNQTWQNLEIIVVDDASEDRTPDKVHAVAETDSRVRFVSLTSNSGAYAARNRGLTMATGEFITVHDADDWSHCEKIERQVRALIQSPPIMATATHWVRATSSLVFGGWQTPEGWAGWVHRNVSSLMVRREVVDKLGYWDRVRCNADTEYYYRVLRAFGPAAVQEVLPGVPMSFGRTHATSLTQQGETGVFSIFGGLRQDYQRAFRAWHLQAKSMEQLYMSENPPSRPFPVSRRMIGQ